MKLLNSQNIKIKLCLEPWGNFVEIPAGETVAIDSDNPNEQPEVVVSQGEIALWWKTGVTVSSLKTGEILSEAKLNG